MKADVLTLAAAVFILGMVVSGLGITDVFKSDVSTPPSALQQGVVAVQR